MKINIPAIVELIKLSDYAPEFGDQEIRVRVNPPQRLLKEISDLQQVELNQENIQQLAKIIGELWGWDQEDVVELFAGSFDTDPKFFEWLVVKTLWLIQQHRLQIKKNWIPLPTP